MLSLLALSIDRYRPLAKPDRKRFSMQVVLPIIWVMSLAMVLPYIPFISHIYLDVIKNIDFSFARVTFFSQDLGPGFKGGEFCLVSLDGGVSLYMRVLFLLL